MAEAGKDRVVPQEGPNAGSCRILPCDEASLDTAASLLNGGGVAVIPTDTVYGLAAHPAFPDAVDRLYSIKGRESHKKIVRVSAAPGGEGPGEQVLARCVDDGSGR